MADPSFPLRFFDPQAEYFVLERESLPHWAQSHTVCFITWRTIDSLPRKVVDAWIADRDARLRRLGIDSNDPNWKSQLARLTAAVQHEFHNTISARFEDDLDSCHGECVLRRPDLSKIVADSLRHFDEERYVLTDFVVMPNHVHVLAAFASAEAMLKQCESWKHYTAVRINRALGRRGRFWEVDGFDHLVRSPEQFEYFRRYIAENPQMACLKAGEYVHYARDLTG
jgi:REP-associated tyrosine transposase